MKFLLDECLPHGFARDLAARGYPDTIHPIHVGTRTAPDHLVVKRAFEEDRIIITTNGADYRRLLAKQTIHSGLIILPNAEREHSWRLIQAALSFLELHLSPDDFMVNRVLEVSADEGIRPYELPASGALD